MNLARSLCVSSRRDRCGPLILGCPRVVTEAFIEVARGLLGSWAEGQVGSSSFARLVLSSVSPGRVERHTRNQRACLGPTKSPSWRPEVMPRVRWQFVHVQARDVPCEWPRQGKGQAVHAPQRAFLRLRGPKDSVAQRPSSLRVVDVSDSALLACWLSIIASRRFIPNLMS